MAHGVNGSSRPLLVDLDPGTWQQTLDRVEPWLATTAALQATFRRLTDDVAGRVDEPHIRSYLEDVAAAARRHEAVVGELYEAFGCSPHPAARGPVPAAVGAALGAGRMLAAQVVGRVAGAHGGAWRGMRELMRSNLDAVSGFAVTEQLGLALGIPRVVDLVFPVLHEKQAHQLLLQEYLLEMASSSILYQRDA